MTATPRPDMPHTLRYSSDNEPGFSSHIENKTRLFFDVGGKPITNERELKRLKSLGIPPAYKDVWICKDAHGHLQMTGRDDAGRKQYRYHADWRDFKTAQKYEKLIDFGHDLPRMRRRIARDLRRDAVDKRFVTAALLRLIDHAALRVGDSHYTEANGSYGATTLRTRHLKIGADTVRLDFSAKGGKRVRKVIKDKTLNRVLEKIHDLPGKDVFQYVGHDGNLYNLDSSYVNGYLGEDFTAKTFRTWHGTVAAFKAAERETERLTLKTMSEAAAARLHNTAAISRSSYIHPTVLNLAELDTGDRLDMLASIKAQTVRIARLRAPEARCLTLLESA